MGFWRSRVRPAAQATEVVVVGGGGGNGFIASVVNVGLSFLNRFSLLGGTVLPGIHIDATRQAARVDQAPGFAASLLGVTGTAAKPAQNPAVDIDASLRSVTGTTQVPAVDIDASLRSVAPTSFPQNPAVATSLLGATGTAVNQATAPAFTMGARISEYHRDVNPAGEIVQVTYDLVRRVGANAQAAVGTAWTNPGNATGTNDGTSATSAGGALAATRGIELAYANAVGKTDLTITDGRIFVYAAVAGDTTGLLTTTTISYDTGAGLTTLETIAGNFSSLTTPREYALGAALNTWTEYDALVVRVVVAHAAASVGITASLDAVEVQVTASRTDAL